jgi:hypothetical protein
MPIAFTQYGGTVGRAAPAAVAIIALTVATAFAQAPKVSEFDPTVWISFDVNRRVRLELITGREESDDIGSAKWKVTAGASFRFKSAFPTLLDMIDSDKRHVLVVGTFYQYSRADDAAGTTIEHRAIVEATGRYAIKGSFLLTDRNRIEFRRVNDDYRFRYRNLAIIERRLKLKGHTFAPFGSAEAFWDKGLSKWNQFRFAAGVSVPVVRKITVNPYFERAHCVSCSHTDTNVAGLMVHLFFKRRK